MIGGTVNQWQEKSLTKGGFHHSNLIIIIGLVRCNELAH
jgi:hypothetical protein